jgi:hypothetical protein
VSAVHSGGGFVLITERRVVHLNDSSKLRSLVLDDTLVTDDAIERLKKAVRRL